MLIEKYFLRQEIQALEQELWNLNLKELEVTSYTSKFNDLAKLCPGVVNPKYKNIETYIWGLVPPIWGLVTISIPTTFNSVIQLVYELIEQCIYQGTMTMQTEKK